MKRLLCLTAGLILFFVPLQGHGQAQTLDFVNAYYIAQKLLNGNDKDISREHVNEKRTKLEAALDTELRKSSAYARGDVGEVSAADVYKLLGRLAVLEGRPNDAVFAFRKGGQLPSATPQQRREFALAAASALALDGQVDGARAAVVAAGCGPGTGCFVEGSNCFVLEIDDINISWEMLADGPHGLCTAKRFEAAAQLAGDLGADHLVEPFRRLAIEAAHAAPQRGSERGMALLVPVTNLSAWYAMHRRPQDATTLLAVNEDDGDYLAARQLEFGTPITMRTRPEVAVASNPAAKSGSRSSPAPQAAPTKRSVTAIDADIADANRDLYRDVRDGGGSNPTPSTARRIAMGLARLSRLSFEKNDIANALRYNLMALNYIAKAVPPFMPLRADLGPAAPECPPGAADQPHCKEWFPDQIDRYANRDVAQLLGERAMIEAGAGDADEAVRIEGYAANVLGNWLRRNWSQPGEVADAIAEDSPDFSARLDALGKAHADGQLRGAATNQAFVLAQLLQYSNVDAALRDAYVRSRIPSSQERAALQNRQRLLEERRIATDQATRETLSRQITVIEGGLNIPLARFEQDASFAPLKLDDAQRLLRDDEVLLAIVPRERCTDVFAVTKTGTRWQRAPVSADWIAERVGRLRAHLDQQTASGFDRRAAFELYGALLAPLRDLLGSRLILAVTSGPLSGLPLGLLVTQEPAGRDSDTQDLRATKWLVFTNPIVTLPSIGSVARFRARKPSAARIAMTGFGAPPGNSSLRAEEVREGGFAELPFAKRELKLLAATQHGPVSLVTGADATERRVRASDLSSTGLLMFATHALTGRQGGEPRLVLAPGSGAADDDGFLKASEVTELYINADVVILSACNTADGDGRGGATLSGLAQSFLFAGGRSVLATHWPVADEAAATLMVDTLATGARDATSIGRALQGAMKRLITDPVDPRTADPRWWAPFVVVGG